MYQHSNEVIFVIPHISPIPSLMNQLPEIFSSNKTPQVVLEPVVRTGMEALKASGRNGRLFVFHSSLPSAQATGLLKNRLDSKLLGTDKEKVGPSVNVDLLGLGWCLLLYRNGNVDFIGFFFNLLSVIYVLLL